MNEHNLAIGQLTITAQIAEHNAPIQAAEGDQAQADLQHQVAADCHATIAVLEQPPVQQEP